MQIKRRTDLVADDAFAEIAEPGRDGVDGRDGADGKQGEPGQPGVGADGVSLTPRGEYRRGQVYHRNDIVRTDDGEVFICIADSTKSAPSSTSKSWMLLVQDGVTPEAPEIVVHSQRARTEATPFAANIAKGVFDSAVVRGTLIRVSGTNRVDLALAHSDVNDDATSLAIGLSNGAYGPGQRGSYTTSGLFSCDDWDFIPGRVLYASPTVPGGVTDVHPNTSGDRVVILGMMLTPNTIVLSIKWVLIKG